MPSTWIYVQNVHKTFITKKERQVLKSVACEKYVNICGRIDS
jgi:hypothetical protein